MRFDCQIDMNNAAFADISDVSFDVYDGDSDEPIPAVLLAAGIELARILRRVADGCDGTGVEIGESHPLVDSNGNTVGRWSVVDETEVS